VHARGGEGEAESIVCGQLTKRESGEDEITRGFSWEVILVIPLGTGSLQDEGGGSKSASLDTKERF